MLREFEGVSQKEEGVPRRWFSDDYFDLIVWYGEGGEKTGFQLCYDKSGKERAITFLGKTLVHNRVDQGEEPFGMPMSPVLVQDGTLDKAGLLARFAKASVGIEADIRDYVTAGIRDSGVY